jgi:hypothetical protein
MAENERADPEEAMAQSGASEPTPAGKPGGTKGGRSRIARKRRQARVLALQTLYETDLARHPPGEVLKRRSTGLEPDAEVAEYARELPACSSTAVSWTILSRRGPAPSP